MLRHVTQCQKVCSVVRKAVCFLLHRVRLSQQVQSTSACFLLCASIPFPTSFPPISKKVSLSLQGHSFPMALAHLIPLFFWTFYQLFYLLTSVSFLTLLLFTHQLAQVSKKIPSMGPSIHLSNPHSIITLSTHSGFLKEQAPPLTSLSFIVSIDSSLIPTLMCYLNCFHQVNQWIPNC